MSSTRPRHDTTSSAADPWWGSDEPIDASVAAAPRRRVNRPRQRPGRRRSGTGRVLLGILLLPLVWLRRVVQRSPLLRRIVMRAIVLSVICVVLASSVGVILINNVVIGRTAELGKLDDRRRELRRDNAVLGAQSARLKAPDLVRSRAVKQGMVPTTQVPDFVYMFDGSRVLTPLQRRRIAAAAKARREAAAAAVVAPTPAPSTKEP